MVNWLIRWCLARVREPSTWKGAVALLTAFGIAISPEMAQAIVALGLAIGGIINVVTPEPTAALRHSDPTLDRDNDPAERVHVDGVPSTDDLPPVRFKSPDPNPFKDLDRFGSS